MYSFSKKLDRLYNVICYAIDSCKWYRMFCFFSFFLLYTLTMITKYDIFFRISFLFLGLFFMKGILKFIFEFLKLIHFILVKYDRIKKVILGVFKMLLVLFVLIIISVSISILAIEYFNMVDSAESSDFFIVITLLIISILLMLFFSIIYNTIYFKYWFDELVYQVNKYVLEFLIAIVFVFIIGISDYIFLLLDITKNSDMVSVLKEISPMRLTDFINVILYWLFALVMSFQLSLRISIKFVRNIDT